MDSFASVLDTGRVSENECTSVGNGECTFDWEWVRFTTSAASSQMSRY